jgi:hypothetical protein
MRPTLQFFAELTLNGMLHLQKQKQWGYQLQAFSTAYEQAG